MSDTPRSDAHFGVLGIKQVRGTERDLFFARTLEMDAKRYRWLLGYLLDNGGFPTYPMIPLTLDMHQTDKLIDGFILDEVNSPKDSRNRIMGRGKYEYICKCGIRVEPHRCNTGEEF